MSAFVAPPLRSPLAVVGSILALTLMVPLLPLSDPVRMDMAQRLATPVWSHPLGHDEFGRDVLSRILWGARTSLSVAFLAAAVAGCVGAALGLVGGYFRGVAELLAVRSSEVVLCLPPLLLALLVVTLLGPGAGTLILALAVLYTPSYVRIAYAETLSARSLDYVTAQRALGSHPLRIVARTILPNVAAPLIVQFSLTVAAAIVLESGLSFLGLGVVPPSPSWGLMIRGARSTMEQAPWLLLWPCLALAGTVLALNALCDRLRDVLDPRAAARVMGIARAAARDPASPGGAALLRIENLTLELASQPGVQPVVRDVSLCVAPGETVALVGESGSGKTLSALAILGLLPAALRVAEGRVLFATREGSIVDLAGLPEAQRRRLRGDQISMVFQDPTSSLNPLHRVGDQVAEAIRAHRGISARRAWEGAVSLLAAVGLPDAARRARSFPHELSGGQCQRCMVAIAIANKPRLLIADEPTTALDVTIQAQILELFAQLKRENREMGMLFVTHNLAVVYEIADRVCVMYAGEVVEEGAVEDIFAAPRHPYTRALLASVPEGDAARLQSIPGSVPAPHLFPKGCRFSTRCVHAAPVCESAPPLQAIDGGRSVRCVRWRELA